MLTYFALMLRSLLFSLALALTGTAMAHDTWLLPERFAAAPLTGLGFQVSSGMAFPALEAAIAPGRVEQAACRLGGRHLPAGRLTALPAALGFEVVLPTTGSAACWVELGPLEIELTPAQVREYLHELDAPAALRHIWDTSATPGRWRERYTKHAKTFITVGTAGADPSWEEPVGMLLEIVPELDPATLKAGVELPVRVLKRGLPLAEFGLSTVHESGHLGPVTKTDATGRVVLRLDHAGRWLLRGTELIAAEREGIEWESHFTTLTLSVGPP